MAPSTSRAARKSVSVVYRTSRAFARSQKEGAPVDGVFLPRPDLEVGQEVDLEIHFADSGVVFRGPGVVLWRRLAGTKQMRPGVGLEFAPQDTSKRTLLFQFVGGTAPRPLVARPRRFESRIAAEYVADGQRRRGTTITDLSVGGAFLREADDLAEGTVVHLEVARAGANLVRIDAVVVWSLPGVGVGVRFSHSDAAARLSVMSLLEPHSAAAKTNGNGNGNGSGKRQGNGNANGNGHRKGNGGSSSPGGTP